jgi:glutamate carboxypeptidase
MIPQRTTEHLLASARAAKTAYLALLERLVRLESPTHDKAAADALADQLETLLEEDWQVRRIAKERVGDQIIARLDVAGERSTLLLTHYDTVWPLGTLERMPYRHDEAEDRVYGPGVLDMKAGIVTGMLAPKLVRETGHELAGPVTLLLTSDEEAGSHHSRDLIEELARAHDRVLVLEPGRDDGALKVGRKGIGDFRVRFEGRSAHAGNNPKDGASAVRELAHFLFYAEDLNDDNAGTSVNLTVAQGGTVSNVIAEEAQAKVDMRALKMVEAKRVTKAMHGYQPRDTRVKVTVEGGINRPPMEFNNTNRTLYEEAQAHLQAMGLELESAVVGGGSDGNFTSALGVPTLDGLGSVGEGPHARHEHIRVGETLERLALLASLLVK